MFTGAQPNVPVLTVSCSTPDVVEPDEIDLTEPDLYHEPEWCPWLFACTARFKVSIADVITQSLNAERVLKDFRRKRARQPDAMAIFKRVIEALVCHVTYEYLRGAGAIRLTLDNNVIRRTNRYLSDLQCTQLPRILDLLSTPELSFLVVTKGEKATAFTPGRQTTVAAGPRLMSRLDGITLDDIDRHPGEEVVLLKSIKDDKTGVADLIDYDDNELADGYREEIQKLNTFLKDAAIQYVGDTPLVDERDRHLKRRFTRASFGNGGRVWGGFWQRLRKADRLANTLINGERVAGLDFKSMVASLAYAYVGVAVPPQDLYKITFRSTSGEPVVLPRAVVKKIFAARLNGAKEWPEELREYRRGLPWRSAVASLKEAHPPIADMFDLDLGQTLAFTESEILVDVLLRLMELDVVALPIHDCIVVAESALVAAERAMLEAFTFHTKQTGRVSIERSPQE
jgi:hypothetical protein